MDPTRFDSVIRTLTVGGSRRRLLGVLSLLPLVGPALVAVSQDATAAKARSHTRKTRGDGHGGDHRTERDPQRTRDEATSCARQCRKKKSKRARGKCLTSCQALTPCAPTTCAAQGETCGRLPDGCGTTLDCGACTCATGCHPTCQTCNAATGVCDDVTNGTPCDDGNVCTQTDTCQNGTCVGGSPVVCDTPPGRCSQPTGTCQPDGSCLYAFKARGAACNDGDDCTKPDACDGAGACIAGAAVLCPAPDQCHEQGVCNPATGTCSTLRKADGTACDDGNACTLTDTCQNGICVGGTRVVCPNPDQCHTQGSCDPATGVCSNPRKPNGASCDDGNACTQTDTCQDGTCVGGNPVVCTILNTCQAASACNPATGVCITVNKSNGVSCDTGDLCYLDHHCSDGRCVDGRPKCPPPSQGCAGGICCTTAENSATAALPCCAGLTPQSNGLCEEQ